jgi:hypothetical protein
MSKGMDMSYLSSLRENLIKNKDFGEDKDVEPYMPESVEAPKKVSDEKKKDEEGKKEIVAEVTKVIDKVDEEIKGKSIPEDIDKLIEQAESYLSILDKMTTKKKPDELVAEEKTTVPVEPAKPETEKLSYRNNPNFNANILYGSIMQSAIRDALKMSLV